MFATLCFLAWIVNKQVLVTAKEDWTEILVNHFQQLHPYQLTIIRNSSVSSVEEDLVIRQISMELPTVLIDLAKINTTSGLSMLSMKAFGYPRKSTVYLVLQSKVSYLEEMQFRYIRHIIDFLTSISSRTMRPRCLLIYFGLESFSAEWLQSVVHYAWYQRFLDFSIMRFNTTHKANIYMYNPFTMKYYQMGYALDTLLFPNKLAKMNGFTIKVPFVYMPPFMDIYIENNNLIFNGSGIQLLRDFSKVLNYTIDVVFTEKIPANLLEVQSLVTTGTIHFVDILHKSVTALRNNKFDMLASPLYQTRDSLSEEGIEKSKFYIFEDFGVSVSTSAIVEVNTALHAMTYFLITICSVFTFIGLGYILKKMMFRKLQPQSFDYFAVITLSLGQSSKSPQRSSERILFFCMVILSLTHFSNIFAKITENHVKLLEMPLSTANDVIKSGYNPVINEGYYNIYFKNWPSDLKEHSSYLNLATNLKIVKRIQSCFNSIAKSEKTICFTTKSRAIWYIKSSKKSEGCPIVRFSNFEFLSVRMAIYFEKGSPYVEKFDWFLQSYMDFGIFEFWERYHKYKSACLEDKRKNLNSYNNDQLRRQLTLIVLYGYMSSMVVFLVELLLRRLKQPKID